MFRHVDHIAVVVRNTEEALAVYRDRMGLPLLFSETLEDVGVRLTHLDMGNVQLQLVEPLTDEHPLQAHLEEKGEGLHHVCWRVGDVREAMGELGAFGLRARPGEPHPAPKGGNAAFIEPAETGHVLFEMTGE